MTLLLDEERAVLAACVLHPAESLPRVTAALGDPTDTGPFGDPAHRRVYAALRTLAEAGSDIDPIALRGQLRVDGMAGDRAIDAVSDVLEGAQHHAHAAQHLETLRRERVRQSVAALCRSIEDRALDEHVRPDDLVTEAEWGLTVLREQSGGPRAAASLADLLPDMLPVWEARAAGTGAGGWRTGCAGLDRMLGGLRPGQLVVLAGRPGAGKTSAGLQIALAVARQQVRVLVVSLEMATEECVTRLVSMDGQIDARLLTHRGPHVVPWHDVVHSASRLSEVPLFFSDKAATLADVRTEARRVQAQGGLGLVVVDYLGLIQPAHPGATLYQQVTETSNALKRLARELDCPVMALAQLNREVERRADERPRLSDLRDSGAIEADADVVILLYRRDPRTPDLPVTYAVRWEIAKHRAGPVGYIDRTFVPAQTRFEDTP